ncbi:hypothetical protein [Priestia megaterium]|uniref:Uncharacterized protein n=1 Tax=Priestia megaterium TaxID=1404 RepID=A0A6M6E6Z8_PRIMG|nr:hypothetical protein [Priestia megaterium]QJX80919.1 hypothetical protein FDZ14_33040 [Priestia megaterium]
MTANIDVMKSVIKRIENEVEIITVSEWEKDLEEFIKHSLSGEMKIDDLMDYIGTIEFDISWNYESLFKEIKTDFADIYATIDFKYSVNNGVTYLAQSEADVLVNYTDIESVFTAIEELLPEELYSLEMQWTFWDEGNRKKFIEGRLLRASQLQVNKFIENIADPIIFKEEENKLKESILSIAKEQLSIVEINK